MIDTLILSIYIIYILLAYIISKLVEFFSLIFLFCLLVNRYKICTVLSKKKIRLILLSFKLS